MNKSVITNLIAAALVTTGLFVETPIREVILNIGLFALAGGVTNWLAIHMLFERVPGLYGSGVISARFEDFKSGIHNLVMAQFFSKEYLDRFFTGICSEDLQHHLDLTEIIEEADLERTYDDLVATIMESSFGSMLSMIGGEEALIPLKDPFIVKMKASLNKMVHSDSFQTSVREKLTVSADIHYKIEHVVKSRLDELTPDMVKNIIQIMIRQHLDWLVVWGGVFGGLIGLVTSQLPI